VVANTDSEGVLLRQEPGGSALGTYTDGTELTVRGPAVEVEGRRWLPVTAPEGAEGSWPRSSPRQIGSACPLCLISLWRGASDRCPNMRRGAPSWHESCSECRRHRSEGRAILLSPAKRILVVDDEPSIRALVSECLGDSGYLVDLARDGAEALDQARRRRPNVILLDLEMPGMDGWAFMAVRRHEQSVSAPVAVMSAVLGLAQHAASVQADAYLAKPFHLDVLLRTVALLLHPA
jgi:CheY-like chemotaxis protein